ncbi:MAG: CPBP family intramembrane metalloprotease, partial [Actinobacteria bacterium]|nr:CPBP family intramembrane metalloprotease [Actinomycetota bacterium]
WWTVPVIVLGAAEAGLIEEIIVVGYLMTRLERLGAGTRAAVGASAVLRGAYHLYQGWGGFAGNVLLGLLFGGLFARTRRLWPLVVAHLVVDVAAGVGYLAICPRAPYC